MNQKKNSRFMPLIMALCVVVGILIGTFYANHFSGNRLSIINSSSNKLNNLLHIIDDQYVDTVNVNDLVEKAMPQILSELDPHSVYIAAKDVQIRGSLYSLLGGSVLRGGSCIAVPAARVLSHSVSGRCLELTGAISGGDVKNAPGDDDISFAFLVRTCG